MNVVRSGFMMCLLGAVALSGGCGSPGNKEDSTALANARAQVYNRATVEFAEAALYKPNDAWTDELGGKLAPLLMQEVESVPTRTFGRVVLEGGRLAVQASEPTLYFRKEKIWLKGIHRDQAIFLWFYPDADKKISAQGVRITLDSDGHPAIWEILNDRSGVQQIFVSRSLEAAAAAQFGQPLSGRQSALERSVADAPTITVSRVISDGPMAMGPAIYLDATHHDVATLICRCMPPQAKEIVSSSTYEVLDMSVPATEQLVKQALRQSNVSAKNWLNEGSEEMEMRLRLPDTF